ncbi:phenylacetate--CoA ligase family protein [Dactylosporangium aurantiacum]|uniref:Phenylacetate--CoA ligase family protein n=1 Tax=Dactylosporangium aurantiacum TaxID=35754 RepID=A0A9Q9IPT1_9ACTN|nr:phenylacetate--CoA ligase family protein [Dactylosporangium aurantiacum]MDG6103144.1 phenylacetate--CoA ligase family protein [Dactylosporangium aurantiacum]UWZ57652.1 phenylacetate--CoA ligase family protein [Dactylosporangium aurantiacum]
MDDRAQRVLAGLRDFYAAPLVGAAGTPDDGAGAALRLFHDVATRVPAYRSFLDAHGVDPAAVVSADDFARVPLLTKAEYHRRYPLPQLCRDGRLDAAETVAVSSGSSGEPTVWPRSVLDELVVARRFEQALAGSFRADRRRTLVVVCFALGSWVGGMYTAAACRHLAAKGYPITVATPGNNLDEILRVVRELGPHFEQVVLAGYPPFVKNVVDAGRQRGVDWPAYRIRLLLAGEVFSEEWRTLVGSRAGMTDPLADSVSLYGTADAGVLGTETPLSVAIRRFLAGRPDAARDLFGDPRLPTLVQYDPTTRYFETHHDGTLLFTGDGGIPLVRYHIADEGGLLPFDAMLSFCRGLGFDPAAGLDAAAAPRLPFVWVFGRSLFTVSYFGANIYPENVTVALERPGISDWVTGKFVLQVVSGDDEERHLSVVAELAPGATSADPDRAGLLAGAIREELLRLNSEFANYVPPAYQTPRVELRPTGDPEYFPPQVKHRYTRPDR